MTTELEVFRLIHNAHTPAADPAEDAVMGYRLPHGLGGRGHWLDMLGGGEGEVNRTGADTKSRRATRSTTRLTLRATWVYTGRCFPAARIQRLP